MKSRLLIFTVLLQMAFGTASGDGWGRFKESMAVNRDQQIAAVIAGSGLGLGIAGFTAQYLARKKMSSKVRKIIQGISGAFLVAGLGGGAYFASQKPWAIPESIKNSAATGNFSLFQAQSVTRPVAMVDAFIARIGQGTDIQEKAKALVDLAVQFPEHADRIIDTFVARMDQGQNLGFWLVEIAKRAPDHAGKIIDAFIAKLGEGEFSSNGLLKNLAVQFPDHADRIVDAFIARFAQGIDFRDDLKNLAVQFPDHAGKIVEAFITWMEQENEEFWLNTGSISYDLVDLAEKLPDHAGRINDALEARTTS